jgi:hypothetical protein
MSDLEFTVYGDNSNGRKPFVRMLPERTPPKNDSTRIVVDSARALNQAYAYSLLLSRADFADLTNWLGKAVDRGSGQYRIQGYRRDLHMTLVGGHLMIEIEASDILGSTVTLDPGKTRKIADWMLDKDVNGWSGWHSGRTGDPEEDEQ